MIPHESDLNGGFNRFVEKIFDQSSPNPWTLKYEERRQLSKEERVKRQVELELKWKNRPVEMLWSQLSPFALASRDYKMPDQDFLDFLAASGITPFIQQRIFEILRVKSGGALDGFIFCKAIDLALEDPVICDGILQHCFKSLPLPCARENEVLVVEDLDQALERLVCSAAKNDKKLRTRKLKVAPKDILISVRRRQLIAVKALFTPELKELSFEIFKKIFLSDGGVLASAFVKQIIEACAKFFYEPFGRFPPIPLRWLNSITPLPFADIPEDADSLLLQDVEYTGIDPNVKKKRRSKKKAKVRFV